MFDPLARIARIKLVAKKPTASAPVDRVSKVAALRPVIRPVPPPPPPPPPIPSPPPSERCNRTTTTRAAAIKIWIVKMIGTMVSKLS